MGSLLLIPTKSNNKLGPEGCSVYWTLRSKQNEASLYPARLHRVLPAPFACVKEALGCSWHIRIVGVDCEKRCLCPSFIFCKINFKNTFPNPWKTWKIQIALNTQTAWPNENWWPEIRSQNQRCYDVLCVNTRLCRLGNKIEEVRSVSYVGCPKLPNMVFQYLLCLSTILYYTVLNDYIHNIILAKDFTTTVFVC